MNLLAILVIVLGFFAPKLAQSETPARITRTKAQVKIEKKVTHHKKNDDAKILKQMMANNKLVNEILKSQSSLPTIWEGDHKVLTGKTYKGILLNSIVSSL